MIPLGRRLGGEGVALPRRWRTSHARLAHPVWVAQLTERARVEGAWRTSDARLAHPEWVAQLTRVEGVWRNSRKPLAKSWLGRDQRWRRIVVQLLVAAERR